MLQPITTEMRRVVTAPSITVRSGLEVLDTNNVFVEDISDALLGSGSRVERSNYATVHGRCQLSLSQKLDWGKDRVRPYMKLSAPSGSFQVYLGVFLLSIPSERAGTDLRIWDVDGYDLLEVLDQPHGETHYVAAGTGTLDAVTALVNDAGLTFKAAAAGEAPVLPRELVWPLDPDISTLNIVNDLLSLAGYRSVYVGREGTLRSEPYQSPADRGAEWTYDAQGADSIIAVNRELQANYADAPNKWVFVRDDPEGGPVSEGDGIYTVINQSDGPTSIDARGRIITKVEYRSAATQTALEASGKRTVDADKRLAFELPDFHVGVNPLHDHFDVVRIIDDELDFERKCIVRSWELPLDGSDMKLDLRAV